MQYQLLPDLTDEEYEALKADIAARGVMVPVEYDEDGNILDGHHRVQAWAELRAEGVELADYPRIVRMFTTEADKRNHVRALNMLRRHLTKEQQREQWAAMRADGMTYQAIADVSGVDKTTVQRTVVANATTEPAAVVGKDGKHYPPTKRLKPPAAPQVSIFAASPHQQKQAEKAAPHLLQTDSVVTTKQANEQTKEERKEESKQRQAEAATVEQPILLPSSVKVYCRDSRDLSPVTGESVQLVVTSPPYNVGKDYRLYEDNRSLAEYLAMLNAVWAECERVLVPGGRICVNVPHGTDRNPYFPIGAHITLQLAARFNLLGTIIWDKSTTGNRTSWGSWRLPTAPSLRDTCELVIVAAKPGEFQVPLHLFPTDDGRHVSPWLDGETFTELTQDHWQIGPESAEKVGHPAPFPIALAERLLRLYAFPGASVLDPFGGSGTVGVAALRLGAQAILVDVDEQYCDLARKRCYAEK